MDTPGSRSIARAALRLAASALAVAAGAALALGAGRSFGAEGGLEEHTLKLYLEKETAGVAGRVEIAIGEIDPRLKLAPCHRAEPFVPPGARLWGRTTIGVRCVDGASWRVYVPVQVKVFRPALVAARPLAPGDTLGAPDVQVAEVDLTREGPGLLTDPKHIVDRVATRSVAAGQALRQDMLRARPVLAAGDLVRVVYEGDGFAVSTGGRALSGAVEGQAVRVQTDNGRVLQGTARGDRTVAVRF